MFRAFVVGVLGPACAFDPGPVATSGDGGTGRPADSGAADATLDVVVDGFVDGFVLRDGPADDAGCVDWGASNVTECARVPVGPLTVDGLLSVDTDAGSFSPPLAGSVAAEIAAQDGSTLEAFVVAVTAFEVPAGATLEVRGARPLIVVVHGDATIAGTLRLLPSNKGCASGDGGDGASATTAGDGGAGGGGAGFGGEGGGGGSGSGGTAPGSVGPANGDNSLVPIRPGCGGGRGGGGFADNGSAGGSGAGGGALEITASGRVLVTSGGRVEAPGAGGRGGKSTDQDTGAGGGGAGSGGAIFLEAVAGVDVAGSASALCANGGSGGEGSEGGTAGGDGQGGTCSETMVAVTPDLVPGGGGGGAGSAERAPDGGRGGNGGPRGPGGGGGGGGAGRIRLHRIGGAPTIDGTATVSPAPRTT